MEWIVKRRDQAPKGAWWGNREASNMGDLIRMGYLENVQQFRDTVVHNYVRAGAGNRKTDLYVWGDSYVKDIPDSVFYGLNAYHFGRRDYTDLLYNLDKSKNNILVIELGERFFRGHFAFPDPIIQHVKRAAAGGAARYGMMKPAIMRAGFSLPEVKGEDVFNPAINQNIEYNLFSYHVFSPIRTFKAEMNAHLFQRGSGDVVIAEDGQHLLLRSTVTPRGMESAFEPLSNEDKERLIKNLNTIYQHFKSEGFDEIYLSVIPNAASLIQPDGYNMLVPYVMKQSRSGRLRMPVISLYEDFLKEGRPGEYYLRGDTHWNDKGQQTWIGKMNRMLRAWEAGRPAERAW
jgi:hypothetical protein